MNRYMEEEVRDRLRIFLARHQSKVSLRKLSALTEVHGGRLVSPATLSVIVNDKTDSNPAQDILASIIRTMDWYDSTLDEPVETVSIKRCLAMMEESYADGSIHVIIGESGYGKTTAFRQYLKTRREGIYAITAHAAMKMRPLLEELCKAVGMPYLIRKSPNTILLELAEIAPAQIIVDEADRMSTNCFEVLRYLHDRAGTSIILLGLPCLLRKLTTSSDKLENLTQLYSRIDFVQRLDPPADEDIRRIIHAMGLKKESVVTAIVKQCRVAGFKNLHRVEKIVKGLKQGCAVNEISIDDLEPELVNEIRESMI